MKAKTFDRKFDRGEAIIKHLDLAQARRGARHASRRATRQGRGSGGGGGYRLVSTAATAAATPGSTERSRLSSGNSSPRTRGPVAFTLPRVTARRTMRSDSATG